jgi:hypothetical protein
MPMEPSSRTRLCGQHSRFGQTKSQPVDCSRQKRLCKQLRQATKSVSIDVQRHPKLIHIQVEKSCCRAAVLPETGNNRAALLETLANYQTQHYSRVQRVVNQVRSGLLPQGRGVADCVLITYNRLLSGWVCMCQGGKASRSCLQARSKVIATASCVQLT